MCERWKNLKNNKYQEPEKENNGPPTIEEKLTKYSDRLSLSDDQKKRIRKVMQDAMNKGEELRKRKNPDRDEIESEKARIRREEEKSIKQHLTDEQKAEYEKMLMNRKRWPTAAGKAGKPFPFDRNGGVFCDTAHTFYIALTQVLHL